MSKKKKKKKKTALPVNQQATTRSGGNGLISHFAEFINYQDLFDRRT